MSNYPDGNYASIAPWRDDSAAVEAFHAEASMIEQELHVACIDESAAFNHLSNYPLHDDAMHRILAAYCNALDGWAVNGDAETVRLLMAALAKEYGPTFTARAKDEAEEALGYEIQ